MSYGHAHRVDGGPGGGQLEAARRAVVAAAIEWRRVQLGGAAEAAAARVLAAAVDWLEALEALGR